MSAHATRGRLRQAVPWLWLAMSLAWAVVIIVTDELAWPLALWIATTVGPLTYLTTSASDRAQGSGGKGNHR
jgi:hypothetical protein